MKGTLKKARNVDSRKSFIVTESGIVETDDEPSPSKPAKNKRDALNKSPILEVDTRPQTGSGLSNEETEKMFKESKQTQKAKPFKLVLDDAKSKLKNMGQAAAQNSERDEMREKIKNLGLGEIDDTKARKKKDAIMSQFLASKAIVLMSTERRKRKENAPKGNIGSLLAMSKFKSRVEKRKQSLALVTDNSSLVNSQVLIGLGKFKKVVLNKRKSVDEKPQEPPEKMR